mmetsp:Transcript_38166/g.114115  ORF Transcript_38166/g.114115 Transcript_38166/m.114115 type:complete len:80 (+) Transcript_38166:217-456(+)
MHSQVKLHCHGVVRSNLSGFKIRLWSGLTVLSPFLMHLKTIFYLRFPTIQFPIVAKSDCLMYLLLPLQHQASPTPTGPY